jgi:hypothetical protein
VRSCHAKVDGPAGTLTCFDGTQVCAGGTWSACAGAGTYRAARAVSPGPASSAPVGTKALSEPGPCANPCDPGCRAFEEEPGDAGIAPEPAGPAMLFGDVDDLPGGWENKLLRDMAHSPARACTGAGYCNADHFCVEPGSWCTPFADGATSSCTSPEYTARIACEDAAGAIHVPICNRGLVEAPAGVPVAVFKGAFGEMLNTIGACRNEAPTKVEQDFWCIVSRPIPAGSCVELLDAECTKPLSSMALAGGKRLILANAPKEDTDGVYEKRPECECADNWSVYDKNGSSCRASGATYAERRFTQRYVAACPPGARPVWSHLGYEVTTPANASGSSSVHIEAHAADTSAELPTSCADCGNVVRVPSPDPEQICSLVGPAPCPRALHAALGGQASRNVLELVFTLTPTPDRSRAPTLHRWQVTYTCIDSE